MGPSEWSLRSSIGIEIPLFPLNVVLFPGMGIPLRIFEPRYLAMIRAVMARDRLFGVAYIIEGEEVGGTAAVWSVGTIVRVEEMDEQPDGMLTLLALGLERFRIVSRLVDDPYPRAIVERFEEKTQPLTHADVLGEVKDLLQKYVGRLARRSGREWGEVALPDDPVVLGYIVGAVLPCSLVEKQRLLQAASVNARLAQELPMLRAAVAQDDDEDERDSNGPREFRPGRMPSAN
jgi:Lon protease-like protein